MNLSDDHRQILISWARATECVRRLWIFGSRARGDHYPHSDLDVAVEIDPIGNDEDALASFVSTKRQWRVELESQLPFPIHLEWHDPKGSTPTIQRGLDESRILIYERAG